MRMRREWFELRLAADLRGIFPGTQVVAPNVLFQFRVTVLNSASALSAQAFKYPTIPRIENVTSAAQFSPACYFGSKMGNPSPKGWGVDNRGEAVSEV